MSNFKRPAPRFDNRYANEGVWTLIEDENGYEYGQFRVGLFDPSLPRVRMITERVAREANARAKTNGRMDTDQTIRTNMSVFVETCLFDWHMTGEDGKPIKFSKDKALEYFLMHDIDPDTGEKVYVYDFALTALLNFVRDVRNFRSDEQAKAGDPTGN